MIHPMRSRVSRFAAVLMSSLSIAFLTTTCSSASTSTPAQSRASISKSRCAANRAAGTITYVSPFQYGPIPGILDIFAAKQLGYFSAECLNVSIVADSYLGNSLVSANKAQFTSIGSAADTLSDIASGNRMVAVATLANTSTYALLTQPSITDLRQLEGKILAYHAPMPVIYTEMLAKAGVDESKIKLVNDKTYIPGLLAEGKYNALQAYRVNEPLTLSEQKKKFTEWNPSQFGIKGTFNTIVSNPTFVNQHPSATADFLRAELHAFNYCSTHTAQCVKIEGDAAKQAGGTADPTIHATAEWNLSVDLMKANALPGKGIGVETAAEWQPEAKALVTYKVLKTVPSIARSMDPAVANSIYRGTTLIWPAP